MILEEHKFFMEFQDKMYDKYGYALDKLNPTQKFWNYNNVSGQREFRNVFHHQYYLQYAKRFEPIRHKVKKVLEIGVFKGHSMLLWHDYFPNAIIYGIDIDLNQKHLGQTPKDICKGKDRIKLKEFNACDGTELLKVIKSGWFGEEPFDIIIDDGSHHPVHQAQALLMYMPMLTYKGTFVIEDVLVPDNEECWKKLNRIETTFNLFKEFSPYWFEDFLKKVNATELADIYQWGCCLFIKDEIWWKYNPLRNFDMDIIPAIDYKVHFKDVDLKGGSAVMGCNNVLKLIFIERKK